MSIIWSFFVQTYCNEKPICKHVDELSLVKHLQNGMQHLTGLLLFFQDLIPVPVILVATVHVLCLMKGTHVIVHQVFQEETVTKVTKCEFYKSVLGYLSLWMAKMLWSLQLYHSDK